MSDTTDRPDDPGDAGDMLAAEYVMGLVDAVDMPQVETLLRDATFGRTVDAWRRRLGGLDDTAPQGRTSEALWARIDAALGRNASAPVARRGAGAQRSWWDSLSFWRPVGMAGAFASALLAVATGYFAVEASRQPVLVAVLMSDQNEATAIVNAYADGRAELRAIKTFEIPAGRAIEIWTLWDRSVGPKSVGLVQNVSGRISLRLDGLPRPTPGQLFEMTLEPATGSPIGRPTGPVLNKGNAATAL